MIHLANIAALSTTRAVRLPNDTRGKDYKSGTPKASRHPFLKSGCSTRICPKKLKHWAKLLSLGPLGKGQPMLLNICCAMVFIERMGPLLRRHKPILSGANAESVALMLEESYPSLDNYQEDMYQNT
ncbi:hypothetical protein OK016_17060 [Vibrio chagasii]|nr:hypothetical protein [Vibrio chagasii]